MEKCMMRYVLGRGDWQSLKQGESHCFLLTNGLGGYSSQTVIGSNARNDHALFISARVVPSDRWTMVKRLDEVLYVGKKAYDLSSQAYVTKTKNKEGYRYLNRFCFNACPEWEYMAEGVRVKKRIVMLYGTNSIAITYEISATLGQTAWLKVTPVYGIHPKDAHPDSGYSVLCGKESFNKTDVFFLEANSEKLYLKTDGIWEQKEQESRIGYYYKQDAVDGREGFGNGETVHTLLSGRMAGEKKEYMTLLYSTDKEWMQKFSESGRSIASLFEEEKQRQKKIAENSGLDLPAGQRLAVSAAAYLTKRESTGGMSIIAGFPFFGDWGRDTMIALYGCTIAIKEWEAAKSILRTFMKYCRRGIMPNLFPEGNKPPMYNTVDASLLFINAAWEYLQMMPDIEFAKEVWTAAEAIVSWYACGTDYNIHMDSDGLLIAGSGKWQLTWMDVRFEDILPTPRHGKPVEINAYWYNAVMVLVGLLEMLAEEPEQEIKSLDGTPELTKGWKQMKNQERTEYLLDFAKRIRVSFLEKFTKEDQTLYDVLICGQDCTETEKKAQGQVRCNQIFALALPFSVIEKEQAKQILGQIRRELYTPLGLRSLSMKDEQFHPNYHGSQFERDMAYHQGTVWVYPLGAYYRACLRYADDKKKEAAQILEDLTAIEAAMAEGCLGQLPEIYSGEFPGESKGCFAQAWSVAELLRVYKEAESELKQKNENEGK